MTDTHLCVAIYLTHTQADEALSRLQFAGFGMNHLSFAGRDTWANSVGSYATGDRSKYCGPLALFWEKLWSLLSGRGVFCSDKEGPILIAGPLVRTLVAAQDLESVNGNGFEMGLSTLGIPEESIVQYKKALMNNQILLFVAGAMDEVNHTRDILNETKAINHTLHHGAGNFVSLSILEDHGQSAKDHGRGLEGHSFNSKGSPAKTLDHPARKEKCCD